MEKSKYYVSIEDEPVREVTFEEIKTLTAVATALVKSVLHQAKLRSKGMNPLLAAVKINFNQAGLE